MIVKRTFKVKEGTTADGRHEIVLLDKRGNMAHSSRGDSRYYALLGLQSFGFEVEWEAGETPEPKPE